VKYFFATLVLVFFVPLSLVVWYWWALQPVNSSSQNISFVVSKSESGNSILTKLQAAGLLRSATASKIYLRLNNISQKLKPGGYVLTSSSSAARIFSTLVTGPKDIWITIPEGWRREQIAARLKNSLSDFDAYAFNALSATYEGQLFPDTYLIPAQAAPVDVLQIFLDNFTKKTNLNLDLVEDKNILILASLVEREAKTESDRRLVAGILAKRLTNNWPLQVDASVQYAISTKVCMATPIDVCDWWQNITDTKYPSAYNTYLSPGLPPGPICNPGLGSIQASRSPQVSPYWFYLTGTDGVTYYSKTLDEHNYNIDKYLRP